MKINSSRIHQEENEPFDFALVFQHPFLPDDPKKRSKKHNPKVEASKIKKWAKRAFPFVPFPLNGDGSIVERQPSQAEGRPADGQQETGGGYAIGPHGTVELDCGSVSPWYGRDWTEWIEEHRGGAPLDEVIETMRQVTVSALLRLGFEVRVVDAHDLEETFVKVRMPDKLCASAAERFSYRCQMAPSVCRDAFPFCSRASYFPPFFPFDRAAEKGKFWWCRQPSADANANEEREGNPSGEGGKQTGGESDDGRGERDAATVGGKMLWQRHDTEGHPIPLHFGEEQLDAQHFRGAYGSQLYSRASSIGGVGGGTTRWGGGGESLAATGRVGARELSPTSPPFDELVRYQEHPRHSLTGGSVSMREGRVSRVDLEENSAVDGRETLLLSVPAAVGLIATVLQAIDYLRDGQQGWLGWVKENADRLRPFFEKHGLPTYVLEDPTTIMSLANAVQIKIFDLIWSAVAPVLTAFENHKLESQYRESLVVKVFLFKFINSFNSLFYIALLKDIVEQEDSGCEGPAEGAGGSRSCLSYLTTQLASIFVVNLAFNAFEIGAPLLSYALKVRRERTAEGGLAVLSRVEKQYKMEKYDSTTDDFMELVIQFGLVAFFSIALPVIPFLAWLMNLLEIRIDAFKLLYCYQRPFPSRSREEGIGAWQNIIRTMAAISCIVNIGLPLFNLRLFSNMSDASRLITFLVAENAVLMARGAVALASSSDMDEIERVRGRHSAVVQLALFGPSKEKDGPARQPSLPGAAAGLSAFRRGGSSLKQGGEDQDGNDNPSPSRGEGGDGRRGQQGPQTGGFVVVEGTFGGSRLVTEGPRQPVEEGQTTEGLGVPFGELPAPRLVTRLD
uniref:Anoctamin transmembrane domain-containing protein n=1 Tax=Chromera velia CCMP2878 TaxID=1169474 RepID=A0A0G4FP98_9ALVE|eukprot:Cvel_18056.t1-p1 / transcript=Cvel_18056.t1 / gene=Cvel_18056 / organism=Chromera_velia_CCMP2878 / gene_product=Anoctamin-10, putative / transcript_product=Anoctamin-10, putative / location=Cvel_scaffold1475:20251-34816(-) / protein_length=846 / sequence_SO=supercontig / SO=protein_coding / is_pseudo=false